MIRFAAVAALAVGLGVMGPTTAAFATVQNGTTHSSSFFFPLDGAHAPASCQALIAFPVAIVSNDGNGVSHGTLNKNGGWGGNTFTGPATMFSLNPDGSLGAAQYVGHVTEWDGGGQNSLSGLNQTEGGITLNFQGTSVANPSQTLLLHFNMHMTTNNSGTPTATIVNGSCTTA
jgi:hypothetical protein